MHSHAAGSEAYAVWETGPRREIARWVICLFVVLSVHGGAALALFTQRDRGELGDPTPVVVEFAALPIATAPPQEVAPGPEQMQSEAAPLVNAKMPEVVKEIDAVKETKPIRTAELQPVQPLLDAKPVPVTEVKPVELKEPKPQQADPQAVPELTPVENAEVALAALAPPPPPAPVDEVKEQEPEELKTPVPVAPSVAVAVTTAPTSASVNNASLVSWRSRIATHLQRHKRYPVNARGRREQGTALVSFTIDRDGKIVAATLTRGSGFGSLDTESLALLRRAEPLPRPPRDVQGAQFNFTVPVQFIVR